MSKNIHDLRRSEGAAFGFEETQRFLTGHRIEIGGRSSNVVAATWILKDEILELEFKDGSRYEYPVDVALARNFAAAPSKGGWRHDHFPAKR